MAESTQRFESPGIAIDRRGRRDVIAKVVLVVSIGTLVLLGYAASEAKGQGGAATLGAITAVVAVLAVLNSAAVLIGHRFDPTTAAEPSACHPGEVTLESGALTVLVRGRARAYPPGSIVEGWIEDVADRITVCLRTREGDVVSIDVPHIEGARGLLAAASVSAEQQVLRMRLVNGTTQILFGGCLSMMASIGLAGIALFMIGGLILGADRATAGAWLAGSLFLFSLVVRALNPARVVIGADGIAILHWPTRRFVSWSEVTEVRIGTGAVILLVGKKKIRLPTGERYFGARVRREASIQAALLNRIEEARAAGKHGSSALANVGRELERAGQAFAEWRERLRKMTGGEALYRRRAVTADALALVLEDAAAPAERRIAAALALSASMDAEVARRVRDAVATCADERLRIALEAASEDALTEQALEEAARSEAKRARA